MNDRDGEKERDTGKSVLHDLMRRIIPNIINIIIISSLKLNHCDQIIHTDWLIFMTWQVVQSYFMPSD